MTEERLHAIIAAYGADSRRWPPAEQDSAMDLLKRSASARTAFAEAVALDSLLDVLPAVQPTADLRTAILAAAPRAGARPLLARLREALRAMRRESGHVPAIGSLLAAAFLLGIFTGGLLADTTAAETAPDLMQLALYEVNDAEF
jgi:hypothetical protein